MQPNNNIADDNNKPFHSSGYAQIANGNRIGATSNISFNQRQAVESSRRVIGEYKHSRLGTTMRGALKANPIDVSQVSRTDATPKPSLQQFNSKNMPVNPKPQNYNPYS